MNTLAQHVAAFRRWASARAPGAGEYGAGEWECDYPDWPLLYAAVEDFLSAAPQRDCTEAELDLLLFVLARDNEDEHILDMLARHAGIAMQCVSAAIKYPDVDARWQAAVLAGRINAADIARMFLDDEAEYVRRRAGFVVRELEGGT